MDFRHTAIDTLTDFAEEFSGDNGSTRMSFGEILFSITNNTLTGLDIKDRHKFTSISDEEWYKIIEKAQKYERE